MTFPFEFKEQPERKSHGLRNFLTLIAALLVIAVAVVGVYVVNLSSTFDSAKKIAVEEVFPEETTRPAVAENKSQNILLMGSDKRGELSGDIDDAKGSRSDTMMVVHISSDRDSVHVMSIMRDSWVDIPGHGKAKMNAALAYGGVPLAVQTIEGLIGSRIDRIAIVDFEGFKGITNALGGVEVDNPVAFKSFEQGLNTLNGDEALQFVRERKSFADGDYQRVRNQQIYIKGVLRKILSAETLTNPVTINNLVSSMAPFLTVDSGFSSTYAGSLGFELRDIRMADMAFFTMPTLGTGMQGDQSVVNVDWDQVAVIKEHFIDDTLSKYEVPVRPAA
ncbi:LytR family transcriptional regulator [Mycetocola manganoxydans]|uniref:LytR family transcriptional regulator n=1 Tax=Mycetocola manganoxydans TaxID=699879 RepID=A0A3L6ZZP7_9MICO|nr:LytR family transcriptional regulator [Mycetocola manganoxydans]GHD41749.1 transcriptional regulator [Mycetocola manganoxydans]